MCSTTGNDVIFHRRCVYGLIACLYIAVSLNFYFVYKSQLKAIDCSRFVSDKYSTSDDTFVDNTRFALKQAVNVSRSKRDTVSNVDFHANSELHRHGHGHEHQTKHSSRKDDFEQTVHRHHRKRRHPDSKTGYSHSADVSGPAVDFFAQPQPTPESQGFIWLTQYSRIPLPVLEEYCMASKQYCPPGIQGPQGPTGSPGHKGEKGDRGDRGHPGMRGLPGAPGSGAPGEKGDRGLDGREGLAGEPGLDGVPGRDGRDGRDGVDGVPGTPGIPGRPGINGTHGIPGSIGQRGPPGPTGPPGLAGPRGRKGSAGKPGMPGVPGISVWKINGSDANALLIPPKMNDKEVITTLRYEEGDNVNLECIAEGNPTPKYSWRRDDKLPISIGIWKHTDVEGSSLNMSRVRREQMGTYVCFANNGVPPQASKKFNIEIAFKPTVKIPKHVVGAQNGSFVVMECILESFPAALTYWMFADERIIENSWKYKITQDDQNQYTSRMLLNITYVEHTDYGMYKCVAKNQLGYVKGIVNLYRIDANDPNSFQEPTTKIYGESTLPPPEVTCPPCTYQCPVQHCKGANSYNTVKLSKWTWTGSRMNQSQWRTLQSRTRKCFSSDGGVLELHQVGKPVYYRDSDAIYGCWMQDPSPRGADEEQKYWMTKSSHNKILYEFANKEAFRNNETKEHKLQYPISGNSQVVYNSSFYYNYEAMNRIVKLDLRTKEYKYMTVPFAARKPDKTLLYETQFNYMDIAADENGLWVIYAANNTNNTIVLKFNAETLQYEMFWNISFDHRLMGEMFIICGVLYGVENVTETKTKIKFAFDLYTNQTVEDVAVEFTNPFRNNTLITYNHKYQRIYALDSGSVIEYPIRFKEATNEENDK